MGASVDARTFPVEKIGYEFCSGGVVILRVVQYRYTTTSFRRPPVVVVTRIIQLVILKHA